MSTEETIQPSSRNGDEATLFAIAASEPQESEPAGRPRVRRAERHQMVMQVASLDSLLPEDHRARLVWEYVRGLDLSELYEQVRAVEGRAGRDAIDPRILMALWLYATLDGVGSARQLARLCEGHVAYRWICGGVSVNYHTLSDFRTAHPQVLDDLLTQSVATLMHEGLVTLHRVAQDGMRVRASAGASSFRRRKTLQQCQSQAQQQVELLGQQLQEYPGASSRRQDAARRRAARERSERIGKALGQLAQIELKKKADQKEKARASTAECVNAISRNRGLRQFLVRGLEKVRAVALWFAIAHNLMRAVALRVQAALTTVGN